MGLPVISFLVIGPLFLPMHAIGQSYYSGYFPSHQQASYFQPYQGSPFSDARHIRRPSFDNNPFQDGSLVKRNTVSSVRNNYKEDTTFSSIDETQGRLLSPSAFNKISETLGALNTVGHFIVDMTRGQDSDSDEDSSQSVPDAILTLTKTVLGQNVTKTIEPLIKRVGKDEETNHQNDTKKKRKKNKGSGTQQYSTLAPIVNTTSLSVTSTLAPIPVLVSDVSSKEGENRCITPDGRPGRCEDLSSCPALLLDLGNLRESLCFKSLFVPGVCCPTIQSTILTTQRPVTLRPTTRPLQSLVLLPQIRPTTTTTTTERYPQPPQPPSLPTDINSNDLNGLTSNNIIDPDDCGQQEYSSGRIVGGIEAPNGQWPWMAAIFLHGPKRTEFWCGGSLIGLRFILTAAHCTRDSRQKPFASKQFTVRLGDIDLSTDTEPSAPVTFNVIEVRAHERFSRVGFYNDVAILVLDRPVRKSKYVIPVCLPRIGHTPPREHLPGRRATVVGWGTTYYGGKESTVQRQADLPIWRNEDCDRAYFQPITDNFLCAGYSEGGVDACQGDSGGPLMMRVDTRWTQLGIVSFGNKCGEPGYPGVYTRISEYIDWINEHTRD